jgi:hypothetical protein
MKYTFDMTCTAKLAMASVAAAGLGTAMLANAAGDLSGTNPNSTEVRHLGGETEIVNHWWNSSALDGDTIVNWDNGGPDGTNGVSHFEGFVGGNDLDRVIIDDFVLDEEKALTWAQLSGVWFAGTGCGTAFGPFRVRVWADDGNNNPVVGEPALDIVVANYNCEETGNVFFGRPEVLYTLKPDEPILAPPGKWWVSLQPTGTTDNFFHLTSAAGPDNIFKGQIHVWYQGGTLVFPQWTPGSPQVFADPYDVVFVLGSGKPPAKDDEPEDCKGADLNDDGIVDHLDLLIMAANWGPCPTEDFCGGQSPDGCWCDESCCGFNDCCPDKLDSCGGCEPAGTLPGSCQTVSDDCPGDLNGDGVVNILDILMLLDNWGCMTDNGDPVDPCEDAEGDCFESNGTPGCEDPACCGLVCAADPFCCEVEWDQLCADQAEDLCKFEPAPECEGASCGNFIPCAADPDCICVTLFTGGGICVDGTTQCAPLTTCPNGNECAPGEICAVDTCCVDNVCVPPSTFCDTSELHAPSDDRPAAPGQPTIGSFGVKSNSIQ